MLFFKIGRVKIKFKIEINKSKMIVSKSFEQCVIFLTSA